MIIVIMGVAGAGKTLIGRMLAGELRWPFFDADEFHGSDNVAKMAAGLPLDDADREPWLMRIRAALSGVENGVLACSALKKQFRRQLSAGLDVRFVYLRASPETIDARLRTRTDHFFRAELLDSQFEALEPPVGAIEIDASQSPQAIVAQIRNAITAR